jgi:hypothetical protein
MHIFGALEGWARGLRLKKKIFMTVKKRLSPFWRILCIYKAMIYPQGSDSAHDIERTRPTRCWFRPPL